MECSVTVVVEIDPEAGMARMEQAVQEAGRRAMSEALKQVVGAYEAAYSPCPHCGSA